MARAGRRSLILHSASFKLQVDKCWQRGRPGVFPWVQHQSHFAASHGTGTGRKQSKCRHQTSWEHFLLPEILPGSSERVTMTHGISILPLCGSHASGFPEIHNVKLHHLQEFPWDWETAVSRLPDSSPARFLKCLGFCMVSPESLRLCPIELAPGQISSRRQDVGTYRPADGLGALRFPVVLSLPVSLPHSRASGHFVFGLLGSRLFQK